MKKRKTRPAAGFVEKSIAAADNKLLRRAVAAEDSCKSSPYRLRRRCLPASSFQAAGMRRWQCSPADTVADKTAGLAARWADTPAERVLELAQQQVDDDESAAAVVVAGGDEWRGACVASRGRQSTTDKQ